MMVQEAPSLMISLLASLEHAGAWKKNNSYKEIYFPFFN